MAALIVPVVRPVEDQRVGRQVRQPGLSRDAGGPHLAARTRLAAVDHLGAPEGTCQAGLKLDAVAAAVARTLTDREAVAEGQVDVRQVVADGQAHGQPHLASRLRHLHREGHGGNEIGRQALRADGNGLGARLHAGDHGLSARARLCRHPAHHHVHLLQTHGLRPVEHAVPVLVVEDHGGDRVGRLRRHGRRAGAPALAAAGGQGKKQRAGKSARGRHIQTCILPESAHGDSGRAKDDGPTV